MKIKSSFDEGWWVAGVILIQSGIRRKGLGSITVADYKNQQVSMNS